jgi:hypothetical protein
VASGALEQVGADVVIRMDPFDTTSSDTITLIGVNLTALDVTDFRF